MTNWKELHASILDDLADVPSDNARDIANELIIAKFLSNIPTATNGQNMICDHCGGDHGDDLITMPVGNGHNVWVHWTCWQEWHFARQEMARASLRVLGVVI